MIEIGNALRRAGRENIVLHSVIHRSIEHCYGKKIIIKSIKMRGNTLIISTRNPLINSELMMLDGTIKKESLARLSQIGISLPQNLKLRFT